MATWTPPSYDPMRIGEFIEARYGRLPARRKKALYNRFKKQGFEFGEDPTGQRQGLIRLTPQMANRLPEGWGADGVQNVGRARPQFDETRFEMAQNAAGRYFLRPITEFSGLGPAQVAALREADARSSAQQELIKTSYNSAADTAAREAQELGGRLAAIPGATGMTAAPSSTAASTGAGDMERDKEAARTAQSLRATQEAAKAALQAPAIRQTGISQANEYGTQAQAARANMLAQFRASQADAAAAADAVNARLRAQDMSLLGTQLRVGGQVNVANANNARQIAVNNANVAQRERQSIRTLQARLAQIDAQIAQANQRNDTATASLLERQRAAQQRRLDNVVKEVSALVQTEGRTVQQQRSQYVQMLVARGYPRVQAIRLANATIKG